MTGRTLVTGFLPFGGFAVNPSALLAERCGRPFELIEVSYAAADEFLARLAGRAHSFDRLLMVGLRGRGTRFDLERLARNHVSATPDVRGVVRGPAPIEPAGPDAVAGTLWGGLPPLAPMAWSDDAGGYLCNYAYYRALRTLPGKRIGFLHVPPPDVMPLDAQHASLAALLRAVEGAAGAVA